MSFGESIFYQEQAPSTGHMQGDQFQYKAGDSKHTGISGIGTPSATKRWSAREMASSRFRAYDGARPHRLTTSSVPRACSPAVMETKRTIDLEAPSVPSLLVEPSHCWVFALFRFIHAEACNSCSAMPTTSAASTLPTGGHAATDNARSGECPKTCQHEKHCEDKLSPTRRAMDTTVGAMQYETLDEKLKVHPGWLNEMDDESLRAMEMTNDKVFRVNEKEMDAMKALDINEGFIQDNQLELVYLSKVLVELEAQGRQWDLSSFRVVAPVQAWVICRGDISEATHRHPLHDDRRLGKQIGFYDHDGGSVESVSICSHPRGVLCRLAVGVVGHQAL